MTVNVKSLGWTMIEAADEMRELAATVGDRASRAEFLTCAARLYRAAGQEGSALLCEETM